MDAVNAPKQVRSASGEPACRKIERKKDALALAEVIYDIYKDKKLRDDGKIVMDQNNAKFHSQN